MKENIEELKSEFQAKLLFWNNIKSKKIKVLPCAKLFARAIRNTHEYKSIAALFVEK